MKALLTRQRNCGRIIYTDPASGLTSVVGRLPGDPIVSRRTSTGDRDLRRAPARASEFTALPLLVLRRCGSPAAATFLHGRTRNALKPYPDGSVSRSYWCNPTAGGCGRPKWTSGHWMQRHARSWLRSCRTRAHDEIEHAAYEAASEAVQLDIKIAEAEAVAEALTDRLGRGEITLTHYDLVIKPVDERIASLRAERAALPDPGPVPGTQPSLGTSRAQWRSGGITAATRESKTCSKMALRGKHLVIQPAQRGRGSADLDDVVGRVQRWSRLSRASILPARAPGRCRGHQ